LFPEEWELDKIQNIVVESVVGIVDHSRLKLPAVNRENIVGIVGMPFLRYREVDGSIHGAKLLKHLEKVDDETKLFLVGLRLTKNKHK
jgi:hypothetical protein